MENFKNQKFDVILIGGQSNAYGLGYGPGEEYTEDDDILYLSYDLSISRAAELTIDGAKRADFSLFFAQCYKKAGLLANDRKLLLVRAPVSGTSFSNHDWGFGEPCYEHMMKMLQTAMSFNEENQLRAFLWHQGESDEGVSSQTHYKNLSGLINSVRGKMQSPRLPFICADFCHEWRDQVLDTCLPVVNAIIDVCIDVGYARFILTDDLPSNHMMIGDLDNDGVHFSRKALAILGTRYFEAYRSLSGR